MGFADANVQGTVPPPVTEQQPVAGVVVQTYDAVPVGQPQVIVVDQQVDYFPACLGTAVFGCFGIAGTLLCCPSDYGKLGTASGFAWFNLWRAMVVFVILMLVVAGSIDCSKDLYPDEISQHDCIKIKGDWNSTEGACFGACPDGYDVKNATESGQITLPHLEGTEWEQYCHESDPTCTGLSRGQLTVNLVIAMLLFSISAYFVRRYTNRIKDGDTYESV